MQKLRLNLDALAVESFDTGDNTAQRGTVQAHRPNTEMFSCLPSDCCPIESDYCSGVSECGTCATYCGSCATGCGTCYDATCGATYCGTCDALCNCTCNCC